MGGASACIANPAQCLMSLTACLVGAVCDAHTVVSRAPAAPITARLIAQVADNVPLFRSMTTEERVANLGGLERIAQLDGLLESARAANVRLYVVSIGYRTAFVPHLETVGLLRHFDDANIYGQDCSELRQENFVKGQLIAKIMEANGWSYEQVRTPLQTLQACSSHWHACSSHWPRCIAPPIAPATLELRAGAYVTLDVARLLVPLASLQRPADRTCHAFGSQALFVDDSGEHITRASAVCRTLHVAERGGMTATHLEAIKAALPVR